MSILKLLHAQINAYSRNLYINQGRHYQTNSSRDEVLRSTERKTRGEEIRHEKILRQFKDNTLEGKLKNK
jgi:hypothetical protein